MPYAYLNELKKPIRVRSVALKGRIYQARMALKDMSVCYALYLDDEWLDGFGMIIVPLERPLTSAEAKVDLELSRHLQKFLSDCVATL